MDSAKKAQTLSEYREYIAGRVSPLTAKVYVEAVSALFKHMNGDLLTPKLAQGYIDTITKSGLSPSTVNLRANAIMSLFRWKGVKLHLDCPSVKIKPPEYLKAPELEKVIASCQTQLEKTLVVVLYDSAVRISELLNIDIDAIEWKLKTITVKRKGGRIQDVNVTDKGMLELKNWMKTRRTSSSRVFGDLTYYHTWIILKDVGKRAGVKVHPHIFRHSRAIAMLKAGVKPYIVQQHLGHKSITTTMDIYGMFMAQDLRAEIPEW